MTLRLLFHLPLRQTEGFLGSLLGLMGLDLPAPDHSTLSRRGRDLDVPLRAQREPGPLHLIVDSTGLAVVGQGQWAAAKHGGKGIRGWRKLHIGVDAKSLTTPLLAGRYRSALASLYLALISANLPGIFQRGFR